MRQVDHQRDLEVRSILSRGRQTEEMGVMELLGLLLEHLCKTFYVPNKRVKWLDIKG